jgi:hypothetical protein
VLLLTLREITRRVGIGRGVALRCMLSHLYSSFDGSTVKGAAPEWIGGPGSLS